MEVNETIRIFIVDNFIFDNTNINFDNDQSFLESGIIDSTGILELVAFIEEHYDINIEDDELIPDNLDSVNNVVNFINKKLRVH